MKPKQIFSSIQNWLNHGQRNTWILFFLFAFSIFIKCMLFHWFYFHSIIFSGIWLRPWGTFLFYLPKLLVSVLLASFVFLFKRKWWTTILLLLIDLWCIANLVYHNANDLLLDVNAILMANNLHGFESSIAAFFQPIYWSFIVLTILYATVLLVIKTPKPQPRWFCLFLGLCLFTNLLLCVPSWKDYLQNKYDADFDMQNGRKIIQELYGWNGLHVFIPFHDVKMSALPDLTYYPNYAPFYVYSESILHYSIASIVYYIHSEQTDNFNIQATDLQDVYYPINRNNTPLPKCNMVFILVESLESWALEMGEISQQVAPHILDFMSQSRVAYFNHIRSQAKHGVSGDGQMLVSSGMLPINAGAACMLYGDNEWPSYISLFPHSAFVDIACGIWNQRKMAQKYGYHSDYYEPNGLWHDKEVFEHLNQVLDTIPSPFFTMALTGATHSPFNRHNGYQLDLPEDMPHYMREYLECLHYTDSCFGIFWSHFKNDPRMQNTTIVMTGDHTVFKSAMLKDFHTFAKSHYCDIAPDESFCPLIISSPSQQESFRSATLCYQMDIYPTILHLIGCESYYWHGFGINLLDTINPPSRPFSEQDAFRFSNQMIRTNYFLPQ